MDTSARERFLQSVRSTLPPLLVTNESRPPERRSGEPIFLPVPEAPPKPASDSGGPRWPGYGATLPEPERASHWPAIPSPDPTRPDPEPVEARREVRERKRRLAQVESPKALTGGWDRGAVADWMFREMTLASFSVFAANRARLGVLEARRSGRTIRDPDAYVKASVKNGLKEFRRIRKILRRGMLPRFV